MPSTCVFTKHLRYRWRNSSMAVLKIYSFSIRWSILKGIGVLCSGTLPLLEQFFSHISEQEWRSNSTCWYLSTISQYWLPGVTILLNLDLNSLYCCYIVIFISSLYFAMSQSFFKLFSMPAFFYMLSLLVIMSFKSRHSLMTWTTLGAGSSIPNPQTSILHTPS